MTRVLRAVVAGAVVIACALLISPRAAVTPLTAASVGAPGAVPARGPLLPRDPDWEPVYAPPIGCVGDGETGPRVQVLYATVPGLPDRFGEMRAEIAAHIGWTNRVFQESATALGGDRQVRFVHDLACEPVIDRVVVGPDAMRFGRNGQPAIYGMVRAAGNTRTDRLYLVFLDHVIGGANYCGAASRHHDDSPGVQNKNNGGDRVAVIDSRCWDAALTYTPAHELAHMLGAIQTSAPNHLNGHCTDGPDVLCRADSDRGLAAGCTARLLDCGGDDYFNPDPARGSYLDTHWNIADSVFLEDQPPAADQRAPDPSAAEA